MKVIVFEPHYNEKHKRILRAFAEGIPNAEVRDVREYEPCDIAVIFGGVKRAYAPTHSKQAILDRHSGSSLIMVESAFLRRGEMWQVGFGGCAGHADFRNEHMQLDRWYGIGIPAREWQNNPDGPVVVCGQLPRDVQVQDVDHVGWCRKTVEWLQAKGLPVRFRPHPKIDDVAEYGIDESLIDARPLPEAMAKARCFVTWNSTTAVESVVAGVPTIACDRGSMAWPVTAHSLDDVRDLKRPQRRAWLAGLGYAQWNIEEMRSGQTWRHLMRR